MTELNSVNSIVVLLADPKDPVEVNVAKAARQNTTGITELADIPHDDTAMHLLSTTTNTEQNKFKMIPPTSTKELVNSKVNLLCTGYNANAFAIQTAARAKAISSGDINLGINMVKIAGYYLKEPKSATNKIFNAYPLGNGEVWVSTKAVDLRAGYIRQYGLTTEKGVPPEIWMEPLFGLETEFVLCGLKVGGIYGMREASILTIPRKTGGGTIVTNVEEPATRAASTKTHKRIFQVADGEETSNYNFGDWIYFVVL